MALISLRSLGLMASVIATAMALFVAPGHAQTALTAAFDHFLTGFPLTGAHAGVDCTSCHVNGRFKGTPQQCFACHNGVTAQGKPPSHPQATNFCEGCHLTAAWRDLRFIDHVQTTAPCAACHNGTIAMGKPVNHPVTAAPCGSCHRSTISYSAATVFNHDGITTDCASCHNGSGATGLTTPPHIPVTGVQCSNCHTNTAPSFVTYTMGVPGHTAVSASRCDACHNGSYTSEGTTGAQGTASFPGHVATNGADCKTCHTSAASTFASWAGGTFVHAATDTNCSNCHNGTTATGMKTPPHIPVTGVQCSNCHTNTAPSFVTYTMGVPGHTAVSASR